MVVTIHFLPYIHCIQAYLSLSAMFKVWWYRHCIAASVKSLVPSQSTGPLPSTKYFHQQVSTDYFLPNIFTNNSNEYFPPKCFHQKLSTKKFFQLSWHPTFLLDTDVPGVRSMGPRVSNSQTLLKDVTLADDDTYSILADDTNRTIWSWWSSFMIWSWWCWSPMWASGNVLLYFVRFPNSLGWGARLCFTRLQTPVVLGISQVCNSCNVSFLCNETLQEIHRTNNHPPTHSIPHPTLAHSNPILTSSCTSSLYILQCNKELPH